MVEPAIDRDGNPSSSFTLCEWAHRLFRRSQSASGEGRDHFNSWGSITCRTEALHPKRLG